MLSSTLSPGVIVADRYQVKELLGSRSRGQTAWGLDLETSFKVFLARTQSQPDLNSVQALKSLHCSGLPRVLEYFQHDSHDWMITEFIEGSSLIGPFTPHPGHHRSGHPG